jgi:hypothetical protein
VKCPDEDNAPLDHIEPDTVLGCFIVMNFRNYINIFNGRYEKKSNKCMESKVCVCKHVCNIRI